MSNVGPVFWMVDCQQRHTRRQRIFSRQLRNLTGRLLREFVRRLQFEQMPEFTVENGGSKFCPTVVDIYCMRAVTPFLPTVRIFPSHTAWCEMHPLVF